MRIGAAPIVKRGSWLPSLPGEKRRRADNGDDHGDQRERYDRSDTAYHRNDKTAERPSQKRRGDESEVDEPSETRPRPPAVRPLPLKAGDNVIEDGINASVRRSWLSAVETGRPANAQPITDVPDAWNGPGGTHRFRARCRRLDGSGQQSDAVLNIDGDASAVVAIGCPDTFDDFTSEADIGALAASPVIVEPICGSVVRQGPHHHRPDPFPCR